MMKILLFQSKQRILYVIIFILLCTYSHANVRTVTVGEGTSGMEYLPVVPQMEYSYTQSIYKQSELNVDGYYITSLSYHYENLSGNTFEYIDELKVYLGHTSKTSFSTISDWESANDMSLVYSGPFEISSDEGWVTIYLDTPFEYNNTDNLVIAINDDFPGSISESDLFYCHATEETSSLYYYSDVINSDANTPMEAVDISSSRPDIKIGFDTQTCDAVADVVVTKPTRNEVSLTWSLQDASQTDWVIEYGESGFTPGEGVGTEVVAESNTGVNISSLSVGNYDFYVKSSCGNDDYSAYSDVQSVYISGFEGEGTSESPYLISSFDDLYLLSQRSDLWSSYIQLTADINASESKSSETYNNSGAGFSPIGTKSVPFKGTFDGNYHVISGLYINRSTDYLGLLGYVGSGAVIENLGIENVSVNTTKSYNVASLVGEIVGTSSTKSKILNCYSSGGVINGASVTGGLIGYSVYTNVTNCYCNDEVNGSSYVGGFVGNAYSYSKFTNCYSSGKVYGSVSRSGFVGTSWKSTFVNCFYDKETSACSVSEQGNGGLSGVTGLDSKDFSDNTVFSDWSFDETDGIWEIGALATDTYLRPRLSWQNLEDNICLSPVGIRVTSLDNSKAVVDWVEMGTETSWIVEYGEHGFTLGEGTQVSASSVEEAGIYELSAPNVYDIYVYSSCGSVSCCYIFCNFTGGGSGREANPYKIASLGDLHLLSQTNQIWDKYFQQVADIDASETKTSETYNNSGYGFSSIGNSIYYFTGCYDGNGYVISNLYINTTTSFNGLFGIIREGAVLKNIGLVSPTIQAYNDKEIYDIGPLVGNPEGTADNLITIENCYSFDGSISGYSRIGGLMGMICYCKVSNCYAINHVSGSSGIGGLCGGVENYGELTNCYSAGQVESSSYLGALIGETESIVSLTYTNCYFDTETSNTEYSVYGENADGITGLTTEEFSNSDNFIDWNFTDTWKISKVFNEDVLRPRFQSQMHTLTISTSGNGTTSPVSGTYDFAAGESIVVEATPEDNYSFLNWTEDDVEISTSSTLTISSLNNDASYVANFTDVLTGLGKYDLHDVSIYPNPASYFVWIEGDDIIGATITIHSVTGISVLNLVFDSEKNQIDISKLSAGTYFVVVEKNNKIVCKQKLIIL